MRTSPLAALHQARGVAWREREGCRIPDSFSSADAEYHSIQEGAALLDMSHQTVLRVTGRDRRSWLHGQVTQEINKLADHTCTYAAILNPQGRMVADLTVYALPDALLLVLPSGTSTPMAEYLDRFLIMERAEIEDLTGQWAVLHLLGPLSPCAAGTALDERLIDLQPGQLAMQPSPGGTETLVARMHRWGEDGYDLLLPAAAASRLWLRLAELRADFSVDAAGWEAFERRRVEAGVPIWGDELDPTVVPLEARLNHAISLTKGCYVGQEIIARIDARGQVNNLLTGFTLEGEPAAVRGATVEEDGRKVGRICTAVHSPRLGGPIALGYLRRELHEPGRTLLVQAEGGAATATVAPLPFIPHDYPPAAG